MGAVVLEGLRVADRRRALQRLHLVQGEAVVVLRKASQGAPHHDRADAALDGVGDDLDAAGERCAAAVLRLVAAGSELVLLHAGARHKDRVRLVRHARGVDGDAEPRVTVIKHIMIIIMVIIMTLKIIITISTY